MPKELPPISTDLAYRLRFSRGYPLNAKRPYEDERVKQIAIKQEKLWEEYHKLSKEMQELDDQLISIYHEDKREEIYDTVG